MANATAKTEVRWWILPLAAVPIVLAVWAFGPLFRGGKGSSNDARMRNARSRAYDPSTGIGRGAPGFQTNVKKVAIPPDIAARIRAGEDVSAEEITQALEDVKAGRYKPKEERERDEWVGSAATGSSSGKRRGGKR